MKTISEVTSNLLLLLIFISGNRSLIIEKLTLVENRKHRYVRKRFIRRATEQLF